MDLTVLNLAVPHLAQDLKPSPSQLLWIVDIYGFLLAGALITMGTLGDRIGRRRLLMIGATVFGIVSVLAAFAPSAAIADRRTRPPRACGRDPCAIDALADPQHVPGRPAAHARHRHLGREFLCRRGHRAVRRRVLLERFWWGSVFLASPCR